MPRPALHRGLLLLVLPLTLLAAGPAAGARPRAPQPSVARTVIEVPLAKGVSIDDAISSMKLRASLLNFKLVAHQPLSAQLMALGLKHVRRLEIYQFCDPRTAYDMVEFNMAYAAYLPCRIAVVQSRGGKAWLVMLDPKRLLSRDMPAALRKKAQRVIRDLEDIMKAGASGAL